MQTTTPRLHIAGDPDQHALDIAQASALNIVSDELRHGRAAKATVQTTIDKLLEADDGTLLEATLTIKVAIQPARKQIDDTDEHKNQARLPMFEAE